MIIINQTSGDATQQIIDVTSLVKTIPAGGIFNGLAYLNKNNNQLLVYITKFDISGTNVTSNTPGLDFSSIAGGFSRGGNSNLSSLIKGFNPQSSSYVYQWYSDWSYRVNTTTAIPYINYNAGYYAYYCLGGAINLQATTIVGNL